MFHYESYLSIAKYLNADKDRPIFNIINEARAEIHSMAKVKIESINDGISASKRRAVKDIGHKLKKLTQDFLTIIEQNPI